MTMCVRHCCQGVTQLFPAILEKNQQNTETIQHFHITIFKRFGTEIFSNKTKFTTPKIDFLSKLQLKEIK